MPYVHINNNTDVHTIASKISKNISADKYETKIVLKIICSHDLSKYINAAIGIGVVLRSIQAGALLSLLPHSS